jgi:hypothetical protein
MQPHSLNFTPSIQIKDETKDELIFISRVNPESTLFFALIVKEHSLSELEENDIFESKSELLTYKELEKKIYNYIQNDIISEEVGSQFMSLI